MNKEAYPDKFLFKGRQEEVLRAFMFQVGGTKTYIHRTVPGLLVQLSSAGGLFNCFKIILGFINFIFIVPIDTIEFFFAMQELDDEETDKIKDNSRIYQYF